MTNHKPLVLSSGEIRQFASGDTLDLGAFQMPATLGAAGDCLVSNGSGQLVWNDDPHVSQDRVDILGDSLRVFIATWKTDNAGSSNSYQITLPLVSSGEYNFTTAWGDGTTSIITAWNQSETTHTYTAPGTYTVAMRGICKKFSFNNSGDCLKLLNISRWDALEFVDEGGQFYGCTNMTCNAPTGWLYSPRTSNTTNMANMFRSATSFNGNISSWNTANTTNMASMFQSASSFNGNTSTWNTSNTVNMNGTFNGATVFNQDLSSWKVHNTSNMLNLFNGCTLSTANYAALLIGWESQAVQNNINFHGGASKYSSGAASTARASLIADHTWTITDGGQA